MSAIRHDRRGLRAMQASPYARPAKKSSWSFSTLLGFLNPLRLGSWNDDSASEGSNEGLPISSTSTDVEDFSQSTSKQSLHNTMQTDPKHSQRPLDPPRDRRFQPPTKTASPQKQSVAAALSLGDIDDSCPTKNIEIVTKFLEERGGNPMSSVELEGVISLLRKSAQPEKHEPFRFSFSTSPTPGRSNSPDTVGTASNNETTQQPRKMMAKNPNGVYRWRGGGSARSARSRNRYASPAFGPSRSVPDKLILKDNPASGDAGRTDNKRRRINDDVTSSPPTKLPARVNGPTAAQPASSDTSNTISPYSANSRQVNGLGAQLKVNGTTNSTSISLRAPGLPKPTTPAVPSPLRQAWSGSSSDVSTSPVQTPPTPPKPTKAANLMAELIKEATQPKKPDVSNPYQTASPVKITPSASKPRPKRTRPSRSTQMEATNTTVDGEMKSDETRVDKITPQAIIEATLPKGSKRARPPAHFEKPANSEAIPGVESTREDTQLSFTKESRESPYTVEEVDEDEDARSRVSKKPKPYLNGRGIPSERRDVPIVEQVIDVEMNGANEKPAPRIAPPPLISPATTAPSKGIFGHKPSSIPKEPSKLRFSYQPENPASQAPSPPPPEVASETKAEPLPTQMAIAKAPDPKTAALALPTSSLPVFTFAFAAISTIVPSSDEKLAREQAISRAESSLPRFSFISRPESNPPAPTVAPVPVQAFNWSAVGIKPPPTDGAGGNWECSTCMLSNPPTAVEKCTVCDTPR
ncbi:hypothetical protein JOM56_007461 [Amanita muscaria]